MNVTKNSQKNSPNVNNNFSREWLFLIAIIFIASGVRLYQLGEESLWVDEFYSLNRINTLESGQFSFNRILYFLMLRIWMMVDTTDVWLRSLSVFFGVGSVLLTYRLGRDLFRPSTGLLAALMFSLSPLAIFHSQEVRMYMISVFLGLAGTLLLAYTLRRLTIYSVGGWLIFRFAAILTTSVNILLLLPDGILLCWKLRRQIKQILRSGKFLGLAGLAIIGTGIVMIPSIMPLIEFIAEKRDAAASSPGLTAFLGTLTRFTVWPINGFSPTYDTFFKLYAIALVTLIGLALAQQYYRESAVKVATLGFTPLVALFVFCQFYPLLWGVDRYFIFIAPYILLLVAEGIVQLWQHKRRSLVYLMVTLYAIALTGPLTRYYTTHHREDWRSVVQIISTERSSDEMISVFPENAQIALEVALDHYQQLSADIYPLGMPGGFPSQDQLRQSFENALEDLPVNSTNLWLIFCFAQTGIDDQGRLLFRTLVNQHFDQKHHWIYNGIEVFDLRFKSS